MPTGWGARTGTGVDRFRLPVGIREVVSLPLLQGLDRFVLVDERVATLAVSYEARYNTANRVWAASQILAYRIGNFVEKNTRGVDEA